MISLPCLQKKSCSPSTQLLKSYSVSMHNQDNYLLQWVQVSVLRSDNHLRPMLAQKPTKNRQLQWRMLAITSFQKEHSQSLMINQCKQAEPWLKSIKGSFGKPLLGNEPTMMHNQHDVVEVAWDLFDSNSSSRMEISSITCFPLRRKVGDSRECPLSPH